MWPLVEEWEGDLHVSLWVMKLALEHRQRSLQTCLCPICKGEWSWVVANQTLEGQMCSYFPDTKLGRSVKPLLQIYQNQRVAP